MPPLDQFVAKALGWTHDFGLYVAESSLRLRANRITTYATQPASVEGNHLVPLPREHVLLVALSLVEGQPFTPVQIQKSMFLADEKIRDAFLHRYNFQPYDYGPFDQQVYADAQMLRHAGLVEIGSDQRGGWNTYAATPVGVQQAAALREHLAADQQEMLGRIVGMVRSMSFTELVSAIYRAYPHMRERSVFRD